MGVLGGCGGDCKQGEAGQASHLQLGYIWEAHLRSAFISTVNLKMKSQIHMAVLELRYIFWKVYGEVNQNH